MAGPMGKRICFALIVFMVNGFIMNGKSSNDPFVEAIDYVDSYQTYSFMIIKDGQTVCEKYFRNYIRYDLINSYSMAKSFMSAILGIAIMERKISLDDRVSDYVKPPISGKGINAVTDLKVRHLATMTSGLDYDWYRDYMVMRDKDNWLEFIQTLSIKYPPGTRWEYSVDPDLLSAVIEKAVGKPLWEYVNEKLLGPIGITDGFYWARDASGMLLGDGYLWWTKDFEGLPEDLYYAYGGHGPNDPITEFLPTMIGKVLNAMN